MPSGVWLNEIRSLLANLAAEWPHLATATSYVDLVAAFPGRTWDSFKRLPNTLGLERQYHQFRSRHSQPFTPEEDAALQRLLSGVTVWRLAGMLGRAPSSLKARCELLGVEYRQSRRGEQLYWELVDD